MQLILLVCVVVINLAVICHASEGEKDTQSPKNLKLIGTPSFMVTLSKVPENAEWETPFSKNFQKDDVSSPVVVTLLENAERLIGDAKKYVSIQESCPDATKFAKPADCSEIKENNSSSESGIFHVWPRSRIFSGAIKVYCDMEDDGGGWTVVQRRGDFDSGEYYFYQDWQAYKNGFGNLEKDFWLGNDNIFTLTNQRSSVVKFTLSDWNGNSTYATYDDFWIDDEARKYAVNFKGYRGTAGDSFSLHNGMKFTTKDQDNDPESNNCATVYKGAWWYESCHDSNLNGAYLRGPHESYADGVEWKLFTGYRYSLKDTTIKIRPSDFRSVNMDITPQ